MPEQQRAKKASKPASKHQRSVWILGILFGMLLGQNYLFVLFPRNSSLPLQVKESHTKKKNKRRFLNYTSSHWESMWLQNISQWEKDRSICENLQRSEQAEYLHKFQTTLCTHHPLASWCAVDDPYAYARYLYNTVDRTYATNLRDLSWEDIVSPTHPPQPVVPSPQEDFIRQVFSTFYFLDETTGEVYTEYIEPLVSHLRHPLALCPPLPQWGIGRVLMLSRSFVVPPPPLGHSFPKTYYFDAGSSVWDDGGGGPSLKYFTTVWKRHGIDFDHIEAWEGTVGTEEFYATVPDNYKNRTFFHSEYIASSPEVNGTFLPLLILNSTNIEDYVLFKLDIDNGPVEIGTVEYLLSGIDNSVQHIDEFVWEHHAGGNYIMGGRWGPTRDGLSLFDSYQFFLNLRLLGVRAHSYV